jgi:hypothetical protein
MAKDFLTKLTSKTDPNPKNITTLIVSILPRVRITYYLSTSGGKRATDAYDVDISSSPRKVMSECVQAADGPASSGKCASS